MVMVLVRGLPWLWFCVSKADWCVHQLPERKSSRCKFIYDCRFWGWAVTPDFDDSVYNWSCTQMESCPTVCIDWCCAASRCVTSQKHADCKCLLWIIILNLHTRNCHSRETAILTIHKTCALQFLWKQSSFVVAKSGKWAKAESDGIMSTAVSLSYQHHVQSPKTWIQSLQKGAAEWVCGLGLAHNSLTDKDMADNLTNPLLYMIPCRDVFWKEVAWGVLFLYLKSQSTSSVMTLSL